MLTAATTTDSKRAGPASVSAPSSGPGEVDIVFSRELKMRIVTLRPQDDGTGVEIVAETDAMVHCRVILSRSTGDSTSTSSGSLKTVRVLLTRPSDDAFFHYRHFADKQLFDSIKGKLSLDVGFDQYPETLNRILASAEDPSMQTNLVVAVHADGRARLQALKTLFGVRKVEVLSLNFLRSPEQVIKQYANELLQ